MVDSLRGSLEGKGKAEASRAVVRDLATEVRWAYGHHEERALENSFDVCSHLKLEGCTFSTECLAVMDTTLLPTDWAT